MTPVLGEDTIQPNPAAKVPDLTHRYLEALRPSLSDDVDRAKEVFREMVGTNITFIGKNVREFLSMACDRGHADGSLKPLGDLIKRQCDEINKLNGNKICYYFGIEDGDLAAVITGDLHNMKKFFTNIPDFIDIIVDQEQNFVEYAVDGLSRFATALPAVKKMAVGLLDFEAVKDINLAWALSTAVERIQKMVIDHQTAEEASPDEERPNSLFQFSISRSGITDELPLRLAPLHFFMVLKNLAMNAADEGATEMKIIAERDGEYVVLKIPNNGKPIPEDVLPNLFKPHFSTHRDGKAHFSGGEGVGLSSSAAAMRHMEGRFGEEETIPSVPVEKGGLGGPQFTIYLKISELCACRESVKETRGAIAAAVAG